MINGLQDRQAVKVGEKFLVCLSQYHIGGELVINGEVVPKPTQQFLVDSIDNIYSRSKTTPVIDYFIDESDLETVSHEQIAEIRKKYYNKTLSEYVYPSLDEEFEHRKELLWIKGLKPIYKDLPEYQDTKFEFKVIGEIAPTGSDFIESALNCGSTTFPGTGGLFKLHATSIAVDEISKFAGEPYRAENSSTGIRWAKASGSFLFSDKEFWWMESNSRFFTNLEDAKAEEARIRKTVADRIRIKSNVDIPSKAAYNKIHNWLKTLSTQAMVISPMKDSRSAKQTLVSQIQQYIRIIESNIKELEREEDTNT